MLDLIKPYFTLIVGGLLLAAFAYSNFKSYEAGREAGEARIQKLFDAYKENTHDQVQKALVEKAKIEAEQAAQYDMAQTGYSGAIDELSRRLQHAEAVPRNRGVCVAGSSRGGVPGETGDSSRPTTALAVGGGVCDSDFYAKAMKEHVQCHYLLELVK